MAANLPLSSQQRGPITTGFGFAESASFTFDLSIDHAVWVATFAGTTG
jgi:hypothetical protein